MQQKNSKHILSFYFIIVLLELIGESLAHYNSSFTLIYIVKPLLMPILMVYYYRSINIIKGQSNAIHRWVLGALFFSFLGDVFLMLTWSGGNLFLFGLGAFLLAHIAYIMAFRTNLNESVTPILRKKAYAIFPIIVYTVVLITALMNYGNADFSEMKVPVIVYAMVIMVMVISAFNRYQRVIEKSFRLVLLGAALFMLSDSIIALNKFTGLFYNYQFLPRLLIMFTYTLAQYFIVKGMVVSTNTTAIS
ncbi:MAG: lysoplasmalogenase [Chitinophagales bacterium]